MASGPGAAVALLLEDAAAPSPAPAPPATTRRLSIWCGSNLGGHTSLQAMASQALGLVPDGHWDEIELLIKAGEGGTWQSAFDGNPLAINGPARLSEYAALAPTLGMRITPYVVVRGRGSRYPAEDWRGPEQLQIRQCVAATGRCVLNLEPGAQYWGGPNDAAGIYQYLAGIGVPAAALEVCAIPRQGQVNELGGAAALEAWTDPALMGSASWECYGITAGVPGASSLLVDEAIPRLDGWGVPPALRYRIPVVQRDERMRWAPTIWAAAGMQIWYLDGN